MNELIIACKTIEKELEMALNIVNKKIDVIWLPSGLHNSTSKLHDKVQEELNKVGSQYGRVLLCLGYCGGYLNGLNIGNFEVIVPKVDDCISLLLGSMERRKEIMEKAGTLFLTQGWLDGERNIWAEYKYAVDEYGEDIADEIFELMLSGYKKLGILETGAYDFEKTFKESRIISETFNLELEKILASIEYIVDLINGPWDFERFKKIQPNSTINSEDVLLV